MRWTKFNVSKVLFVIFSIFSSSVFSQIVFGPELVNSTNGDLKTFVYNLSLGDNLPGTYLLKLQNGSNGPALLQQCQDKPTVELKRQCQYENLVDRIENQLTRLNSLNIIVNGVKISSKTLLNKSSSYLEFPIQLGLAVNEIKISVQGNPEAFANVQIEELATTDLPPRALFSINSNYGRAPFKLNYNAAQSFDPLNKVITYEWFVNDTKISDLKSGSYIFENPGESTLKLKVTNSAGFTSELSTSIITLNPAVPATNTRPVPKIVVSYPDPMNLRLVKVSALDSYDPDGFVVKTEINFGDTVKVISSEALHQFANDGTFLISVRVTDNLGLVSAIEKSTPISQNTQLSKVSSLYGPNTYYGSFSSYNDYLQTINVPAAETADLYRIKIKNADGKDHLVRTCSGTTAENIMCAYNNLLSKAYIALYRVDYANIYLNNIKITDSISINKNQKTFQTYLKLSQINQLKIRLKGWPTAYVDVEVEKLGQVPDTTPPVLSSNVDSGTTTRSNLVHIAVEDNSNVSTEIYQNDALVATQTANEFDLTLQEGVNHFILKSKDAENNVAQDFILSNITLDSTAPVSTPLDLKAKYIFTSLPQVVTLNLSTNEPLSSATANGEALVQISPTQYQYQIKVFDQVRTTVQVRFKDLVGNEGVSTYYFLTEIDALAPVLTMSVLPATTKLQQLTAAIRITEKNDVSTSVKVNGQVIATSALKSFNQIIPLTNEGINLIEVVSVDGMGNISNTVSAQVVKDTVGPALTLNPTNNTIIAGLSFTLSGTSNEALTQVLVGGKTATLSTDKMSFTYNYVSTTYGIKNLAIQSKDILGNISTIQGSYSLQNASVPIITSNVVNGSTTNNSNIQVNVLGNGISNLKVVLDGTILIDQNQTSFNGLVENDGVHTLEISATNLAGTTTNQNYSFTLDQTPPFINLSGIAAQTTMDTVSVNYNFWDVSAATFRVVVDQVKIYESTDVTGSFDISLLSNGLHTVTVSAIDIANNMSLPMTFEILKDNTNPIISIISPADGDYVDGSEFKVKARVDDQIQSIRANGRAMTWNDTEALWETTFAVSNADDFIITVEAVNSLNLVGEATVNVKPLLFPLVPALLGLYEDAINNKMLVKGAAGSTRPFMNVKVKTGIFSSETVQADKNGSFMASLDINDEYTVIVNDPLQGQEYSHKLTRYSQETILSGVVKDNNDMPLVGVNVTIGSENLQASTNSSGVFEFKKSDYPNSRITGDQVITIDGRIASTLDGSPRSKKFSITKLNFSMSHKQNNIIQNTIYLYPTYLDTGSTLTAAEGGEITSPEAEGVTLSVPYGVGASFPSGALSENISMFTVNPDKITIKPPTSIQAQNIVVLEPSGTTFADSVELTIPNFSNLPPQTSMYFLLYNSKSGEWEIGGAGKVSEDGQSVTTDEGKGIRHFSDVLAVPTSPDILAHNLPNKPGADTFSGSNVAKIEMPSFKVLGNTVSPSLIYKSSWAKPSTTITNIFNFAETDVQLDPYTDSVTQNVKYYAKERKCSKTLGLWTDCHDDYKKTYEAIKINTEYSNLTALISPKLVSMNLITADINTPVRSFTNIPRLAQLSNYFELKNNDDQYLPTGLYPYNAHYTINYDQLIIGTARTKYYSEITGAVDETKPYEASIPGKVFGTDLFESLYVQNYRNSEAGQGWKIAGIQKIVNPNSSKIMIEEGDGGISTYDFDNTISTVVNFDDINGDSSLGVSLNEWPKFTFTDKTTQEIKSASPSGSTFNINVIGQVPKIEGRSSGHSYYQKIIKGDSYQEYVCDNRVYFPGGNICTLYHYETRYYQLPETTCLQNSFTYKQSSKPTQYISTSSGAYVIDGDRHSLNYVSQNQYTNLIGYSYPITQNRPHFVGTVTPITSTADPFDYNLNNLDANQFTHLMSQFSAVTTTVNSVRAEIFNYAADCNQNALIQLDTSGPDISVAGDLVNPSSIVTTSNPNVLMIANTGKSNIVSYNISTNELIVVAGKGTANDTGDNLLAVDADIANPKGLAFDNHGNLFVSTSFGHIRKISTDGTITTVAGNALNGLYVSETEPLKMRFNDPYGMVFDSVGNSLFVADSGNNRIVKIDFNTNLASTVAGNNGDASDESSNNPLKINLLNPTHLTIDQDRNLIIVDSGNKKIRKMNIDKLSAGGDKKYLASTEDFSTLIKKASGGFERLYRDGRKEIFDSAGRNTESIASNGLAVNFQYNEQSFLKKIIFPNQDQVVYNYSSGKLDSIVDIAGRVTAFNYNNLGQLTSVDYPDTYSKQFEYDSSGLLTKETNQKGFYRNFEYNQFDRLEKVTDSTSAELIVNDSTTKGMSTVTQVQAGDIQLDVINPKNDSNNDNVIVDPNGNRISMKKDLDGYISQITDPRGRTQTIKRNALGKPVEITDIDNVVVQNTFDPVYGDLIETRNVTLDFLTKKTFNENGRVTSETDQYSKTTSIEYNEKMQILKKTFPDGKYIEFTYNQLGQVLQSSNYNSTSLLQLRINYEYDSKGRLHKQVNQDGKFTSFTYDLSGNIQSSTSNLSNSESATTSFEYDSMNRLKKVKSPKNETTEYTYSRTGELLEIKDPNGKVTSFEYDIKGRLTKKTDPNLAVTNTTYDANNNILTEVDPAQQAKVYRYNEVNKVTQIQLADDTIYYDYNIKDEVIGIRNSAVAIVYGRDKKQRIISESVGSSSQDISYPSHLVEYDYTSNDLRSHLYSPYQNISYFYNPQNYKLVGIQSTFSDSLVQNYSFSYDEANRLSSINRPGSKSEFNYDLGGNLVSIVNSASGDIKSSFNYQYDLRNYITQKTSLNSTFNYTYDLNGQLLNSSKIGNSNDNEAFSFDSVGNRLTYNGVANSYDISAQRIIDDGQYTYSYDLNGNILAKNSKNGELSFSYEYNSLNQIKVVNIFPSPNSISVIKKIKYIYDPSGRRVLKSLTDYQNPDSNYTKKYYYDDANIIAELGVDNNLLATYTYNHEASDDILSAKFSQASVSISHGGNAISDAYILSDRIGSVFFVKDQVNSISEVLDSSGNIIQKYDYSAFGILKSIKNATNQEFEFHNAPIRTTFTFNGREFESETKTYNFRARQYDPSVGRFMQQDPVPGELNRPRTFITKYGFVENTPTMFTDPTGRETSGSARMRSYFPNPSYAHGEYCGSAAVGNKEIDNPTVTDPIDNLDRACQRHDQAYKGDLFYIDTSTNGWNPDYSQFEARVTSNLNLISEGFKHFYQNGQTGIDGLGVALFGMLNLHLELYIIEPIANIMRLIGL